MGGELLRRPRDSESESNEANLVSDHGSKWRRGRAGRRTAVLALAGAVVLGVATGLVYQQLTGSTRLIESSYAFDVTNPRYLAGYADNVFIGTVRGEVETRPEDARTLYAVDVETVLKGQLSESAVVNQLGYRAGGDVYRQAEQPLLEEGRTYLLATTADGSGEQTLIAGPVAVEQVTAATRGDVIRRWTAAIAQQTYPPGIPPR